MQRIPKLRGFKNPFRIVYTPVNLDALGIRARRRHPRVAGRSGLARKGALVKVLGRGELHRGRAGVRPTPSRPPAEAAITGRGRSVERVPLPFGPVGRRRRATP